MNFRIATAAVDFADQLRVRRTDGAQTTPRSPFDDGAEVEELIVSAACYPSVLLARQAGDAARTVLANS